jgi:hypothetical protein
MDILAGNGGGLQLDQPPLQLDQQQPPPTGDPNLPPYVANPQARMPVQQDPNTPQLTSTIPSETLPRNPDTERDFHESRWRNILDKVGAALGGGETVHLTKDADGNISEVHMPSTTSEKWGRVAKAALGGAALGAANSRGPGGLANAAAAGLQYGLNVPKQERENIDAQETAAQRLQVAKANNAKTQQDLFRLTLQNNALKTSMDEDSAKLLNDYRDKMMLSENSSDFGAISGWDDLTKVAREHQDFMHAHTNLQLTAIPVPDGKGGTSLHAIAIDPGDDNRPTEAGDVLFRIEKGADGRPVLKTEPASRGQKKITLRQANQSVFAQYLDMNAKWASAKKSEADAEKAGRDQVPKTYQEAFALAAQAPPGSAERERYTALGEADFKRALQLKATTTIKMPSTASQQTLANWGARLADPRSGVTMASIPTKERDAVNDYMASAGLQIAHPLTAKELERSDLAGNAISNINEAERILKSRPDLFGPVGFMKKTFKDYVTGGDPDALAYLTAINLANLPAVGIHGVRGRWALEDLSKLDSDLYHNKDAMQNVLDEIRRSASEFSPAGGRQGVAAPPAAQQRTQPPPTQQGAPQPQPGVDWSKFPKAQ